MIKKYIGGFFIMISSLCLAQEQVTDTVKKKCISDEYVELYDDFIKVRLSASNSFNSFHIKDGADNLDFRLSPNQRLKTTLTLMYKFIEIDVGYTPQFIRFNKDDNDKGKTTFYNLGTRFYFGKWMQDIQYIKTKGFYINKEDIGVRDNVLFPDFQVQKIGGSTSYIFNPNFSFRAIFLQSQWQKKSTGSFVPSITYYYTQIKNNGPSKDNIIDLAAGPAYYYNWVIADRFLVSGGAYAGIGYNSTKTRYNNKMPDESVDGLSWQSQFRLMFGYNSAKFYIGATASLNSFYYDTAPKLHVEDQQQFFEFYIGYRFLGPDKVNKFFDDPSKLKRKAGN